MNRSKAAIVAALMMSVAIPAAAKPICYTPTEIRAMQFRQLQVEMMVAALKCRGADPSFQDKYAGFVSKAGPVLNQNARELRAMFTRLGKGAGHVDKYMTELSNEASMRSLHVEFGEYCAAQDETFGKILTMKAHEIEAFAAATIEKPYSPASCSAIKEAKATIAPKAKAPAPAAKATAKKTESKG